MRRIVTGVAEAHEVTAQVSYDTIFPPTINDAGAVAQVAEAACAIFGKAQVTADCEPKLFSEDFAHMAAQVPGCFLLLGNGTNGAHARPLHSADYDFNDAGLVPGSAFWVELVQRCLKN